MSASLAVVLLGIAGGSQGAKDPAPPVVHELAPASAPEARATDALTFHGAPKPRAADAVGEDWPAFRGPRGDGRTLETRLAAEWTAAGPPLVWELVAGSGFATPVIADGSVYVHGLHGELVRLELATGRVVWQRNTCKEFGIPLDFFGVVASPLVHGDLLIQNLGAPGPCVAAFDRATGKLAWGAGPAWGPSCASPVIGSVRGAERLFVLAGGESRPPTGGLVVLEPATGAVVHTHPFRSKIVESVTGSSPVVAGERVFVSASYGTGSACLEATEEGGFREAWTDRHIGLQFSSAIHDRGVLYLIDGVADRSGALVALDPASGRSLARTELVWDETDEDGKSRSFTVGEGSLLHADGKLLCLGDNGHLLWLEASSTGAKVLARTRLFGANESWTPPVVVNGLLYVRQTRPENDGDAPARLLCYDLRAR